MKKFTFVIIMIAFAFGFSYQANATKAVKPTKVTAPADFRIPNGYATTFTYWIKNTGDEAITATDSIYVTWGLKVSSTQIQFQQLQYLFKTSGLAVGDSFAQSFTFSLSGSTAGTAYLAFAASMTTASISYILVPFNFITGIQEKSTAINKVYYSNDNLNITFNSKGNTTAQLVLINLNGQTVAQRTIELSQGEVQESLNLGVLPKGVYILNMQTANGTDSKKFMVQ